MTPGLFIYGILKNYRYNFEQITNSSCFGSLIY